MKCRPGGPPCDDNKVETHEKITNAKGHRSRHLLEAAEESPRCANSRFLRQSPQLLNSVHFHLVKLFKVLKDKKACIRENQIGRAIKVELLYASSCVNQYRKMVALEKKMIRCRHLNGNITLNVFNNFAKEKKNLRKHYQLFVVCTLKCW